MTNYNDGNWHGWNGGECPVHHKSRVDIAGSWGITRNKLAGDVSWNGGVIAFSVVKEHREPREWWIYDDIAHPTLGEANISRNDAGPPFEEIIHVREVLE